MEISSIDALCKAVAYTNKKNVFETLLSQKGLTQDKIELLWYYYYLLHFSDYFSAEVRVKFSKETTYKELADKLNVMDGTLKGRIKRSVDQFTKRLGIDLWVAINSGSLSNHDIKAYCNLLQEMISKSNVLSDRLVDIFSINILDYMDISAGLPEVGEEDFNDLTEKFRMFSLPFLRFVASNMDKDLLKYGIKLLTTPEKELTHKAKIRKKRLEALMRIKL